ncbi:DUF2510 domain-containing protein [Arthrobacter sp. AK01]|uniref:DUF2510 domain-containing protein n=1 Tax=Arthrobacter sp. AK01 TaxID=2894084 RepID=UPI001E59CE45|nr:DUF2510 domain-containing protein [Arthrobacter sp. AK01]MCD4850985.1 DUF2510 domain-containing protein [Arthrobacter sp. AK01]
MTAAPGWYPPPETPRPLLPTDQAVGNPFVWLLACLPFGVGTLMLSWNPEVHAYIASSGYLSIDPTYIFTAAYFAIMIGLILTYGATVVLAVFDYRWLVHRGVVRPFNWAWSFLGGVPYVIGRAVVIHKVAPRRGLWPIAVIVAAWGLYIVAGFAKALPFMQSVFYELGY